MIIFYLEIIFDIFFVSNEGCFFEGEKKDLYGYNIKRTILLKNNFNWYMFKIYSHVVVGKRCFFSIKWIYILIGNVCF